MVDISSFLLLLSLSLSLDYELPTIACPKLYPSSPIHKHSFGLFLHILCRICLLLLHVLLHLHCYQCHPHFSLAKVNPVWSTYILLSEPNFCSWITPLLYYRARLSLFFLHECLSFLFPHSSILLLEAWMFASLLLLLPFSALPSDW